MVCAHDERGRGAHREKSAECRYSLVDNEEGEIERPRRRKIEIVGLVSDEARDRAVKDRDEVRR